MLYDWIKSIIIYLIISGIIVNLSPGNNYKKYIQFFTGLLLIVIMAEPVSLLLRVGFVNMDIVMEDIDRNVNGYKYNKENVSNYYELSINDSIYRYLNEEGFCPSKIEVIVDSEYKILKCTINYYKDERNNYSYGEEELKTLKNKISDVYNVEVDNIYIVSR